MALLSKKKAIKAVSIKKEQLLKYLEHLGECKGELFFNEEGYLTFKVSLHYSGSDLSFFEDDISRILSSRRRDEYEYKFYPKGDDEILITERKLKSNRHEERKRKKKIKKSKDL